MFLLNQLFKTIQQLHKKTFIFLIDIGNRCLNFSFQKINSIKMKRHFYVYFDQFSNVNFLEISRIKQFR
jgi:hypothetical protein